MSFVPSPSHHHFYGLDFNLNGRCQHLLPDLPGDSENIWALADHDLIELWGEFKPGKGPDMMGFLLIFLGVLPGLG